MEKGKLCLLSSFLYNIMLEFLASELKQYSIEKEDATLFLFSGDIIVIMEKILKNPIEILLEL